MDTFVNLKIIGIKITGCQIQQNKAKIWQVWKPGPEHSRFTFKKGMYFNPTQA